MAKNTILINDFRAGELTPDMDARVDLKDYYRGCRILENAMPIIEGGVARVPGTYYVRPVKTDEGWCLRVTKSGTGTGIVTSDLVPGINCGSSCYVFFVDGITVVLTATPDSGMSFVAWSGDGTGLVTRSLLMNGNKVVNAEFSSIIKNAYLIGWYKFNEGTGLVAANSATDGSSGGGLLPNLTVTNGSGTFWTARAGFGSVSTSSPSGSTDWASATLASALTYGGTINGLATCGMFFRTSVTVGSRVFNLSESLGVPKVQIAPNNPDANDITINASGAGVPYIDETMSVDTWYFVFLDSDGYVCQILPNGTLTVSATAYSIANVLTITLICIGTGWPNNTDGLGGSFGDTIVYNFTTLTRSQWGSWYDKLRSRYGMAARSGW